MAGNNDRIHGYNPIYRQNPERFNSFALNGQNPGAFIGRLVNIATPGDIPPALDHQGHIVPQNTLNVVLNAVAADMGNFLSNDANNNVAGVQTYIANNVAAHPWLQDVYNYGVAIGAPMFEFDTNDANDKVDGFFSIVTWNPVNICRAPSDDRRGGLPGNDIDHQVNNYLEANQAAQGVGNNWLNALDQLMTHGNGDNNEYLLAYINACSATLNAQLAAGIGYYSFPWESDTIAGNSVLYPER